MAKNIELLAEGCPTLKDLFAKAKAEGINLHSQKLKTGKDGFTILDVRENYALIKVNPDNFDESVINVVGAHPYGCSIFYNTK